MGNKILIIKSFYNVDNVSFKNIDSEKLYDIIRRSNPINRMFLNKDFKACKSERYLKIMELIYTNYREGNPVKNEYATTSHAEKFLLFMFSIDPNFEAAIIYGSEDRTFNAKKQIEEKFGVYDINLIKIEKLVIKKILSEAKRNQIYEEIDKRAFK